jgi:hypothetical protein
MTTAVQYRAARIAAAACLSLLAVATAGAQGDSPFTVRAIVGATSPAGSLKDQYSSGGLVGVQGSWNARNWLSVTATTMWANAPTFRTGHIADYATMWNYDAGVELRHPKVTTAIGSTWALDPFVGGGYGSRAYMLTRSISTSTTSWASYAGIGADLNRKAGRWGFRLEARDYFGSFTNPEKTLPRTNGSDLNVFLGFSYR